MTPQQPLPQWPLDILSLIEDGNRKETWLTCCLLPLLFLVFGLCGKGNLRPVHGKSLLREEKETK